jgi:2-oxoisovalerate dehydrogenase E2 component (dihydrolipoyl transacylase)
MPSRGAVSPTAIFRGTSAEAQQVDTKGVEEFGKYSRITMLPLLLKSLSRAMMEWPLFRSSITPNTSLTDKPTLTLRPTADVSIALATPTGLYTPTISSLESLTPYEIASRIKRFQVLGERVPCGLTPADMPKKGAAISISNVGAIGKGEDAVPRLVEGGGVAIVAIGRARWEVRVMEQDGNISSLRTDAEGNVTEGLNVENRLMLPVSWSADHRIVEGAEMAAFVESWRGWVEQPMRLIGEGR